MLDSGAVQEIRANSVLPATREPITLTTADGLRLVGELASPVEGDVNGTLVCVHPLPTDGGMMDSHLFRKAAWRLPALAGIAVLRFNTRGTESPAGASEGTFDDAGAEGIDVQAAVDFVVERGLPTPWLVGWSFGTEINSGSPKIAPIAGAILISPPLQRAGDDDLDRWAESLHPMTALVPQFDDYLRPLEARARFQRIPQSEVLGVDGAKHLWIGEPYVQVVMEEIVRAVAPEVLDPETEELPTEWDGPMKKWTDL